MTSFGKGQSLDKNVKICCDETFPYLFTQPHCLKFLKFLRTLKSYHECSAESSGGHRGRRDHSLSDRFVSFVHLTSILCSRWLLVHMCYPERFESQKVTLFDTQELTTTSTTYVVHTSKLQQGKIILSKRMESRLKDPRQS